MRAARTLLHLSLLVLVASGCNYSGRVGEDADTGQFHWQTRVEPVFPLIPSEDTHEDQEPDSQPGIR